MRTSPALSPPYLGPCVRSSGDDEHLKHKTAHMHACARGDGRLPLCLEAGARAVGEKVLLYSFTQRVEA